MPIPAPRSSPVASRGALRCDRVREPHRCFRVRPRVGCIGCAAPPARRHLRGATLPPMVDFIKLPGTGVREPGSGIKARDANFSEAAGGLVMPKAYDSRRIEAMDADGRVAILDFDACLDASGTSRITFFIGAGVSQEAPARIPTGQTLRGWIVEQLSAIGETGPELILPLGELMPEVLMEVLERVFPGCVEDLLRILDRGEPNHRHVCIARLGNHAAVATLNFDTLIESASGQSLPVLHLHGQFGSGAERYADVVFNISGLRDGLRKEVLDSWRSLHRGCRLVMIAGYSDNDFDTAPVIAGDDAFDSDCPVVWHVYANGTDEARRAVLGLSDRIRDWARRRGGVHFVHVDLNELLDSLVTKRGAAPPPLAPRVGAVDIRGLEAVGASFRSRTPDGEDPRWRARLAVAWLLGDSGLRPAAIELLDTIPVTSQQPGMVFLLRHKRGDLLREIDEKGRALAEYDAASRVVRFGSPEWFETEVKRLHIGVGLAKRTSGLAELAATLGALAHITWLEVVNHVSGFDRRGGRHMFNTEADLDFVSADFLQTVGLALHLRQRPRIFGDRLLRLAAALVFAQVRRVEAEALGGRASSKDTLERAREIYSSYRDTKGLANTLVALAARDVALGDHLRARAGFDEAWELYGAAKHEDAGRLRILLVALVARARWNGPLPFGWTVERTEREFRDRRAASLARIRSDA